MDQNKADQIGGALYEEILRSRHPLSAAGLAQKIHVKEEVATKLLRNLCDMKLVAVVDNKYINAELVPEDTMDTSRTLSNTTQPTSQAVAIETHGAVSKDLVLKSESQVMQCSVDRGELVRNEDAIQKIIKYLTGHDDAVKSFKIAQETGLGSSRSAVNRYLYFLVKQGVLSQDGVTFKLIKHTKAEDITVMAAQLAKTPQGKKKSDSTSTMGESGDCPCPNRGPNCTHNHFTQNVHHHQYNMQFGDGNNIFMDSRGPKKPDA